MGLAQWQSCGLLSYWMHQVFVLVDVWRCRSTCIFLRIRRFIFSCVNTSSLRRCSAVRPPSSTATSANISARVSSLLRAPLATVLACGRSCRLVGMRLSTLPRRTPLKAHGGGRPGSTRAANRCPRHASVGGSDHSPSARRGRAGDLRCEFAALHAPRHEGGGGQTSPRHLVPIPTYRWCTTGVGAVPLRRGMLLFARTFDELLAVPG